jgi:hypothetical protein
LTSSQDWHSVIERPEDETRESPEDDKKKLWLHRNGTYQPNPEVPIMTTIMIIMTMFTIMVMVMIPIMVIILKIYRISVHIKSTLFSVDVKELR